MLHFDIKFYEVAEIFVFKFSFTSNARPVLEIRKKLNTEKGQLNI